MHNFPCSCLTSFIECLFHGRLHKSLKTQLENTDNIGQTPELIKASIRCFCHRHVTFTVQLGDLFTMTFSSKAQAWLSGVSIFCNNNKHGFIVSFTSHCENKICENTSQESLAVGVYSRFWQLSGNTVPCNSSKA